MIGHLARLAASLVREHAKKKKRSPQWAKAQRDFKRSHPYCIACGGTTFLQVHHIVPVSNAPELELEASNLLTLCMGANDCHFFLGHGGNFKRYNPRVREHAREMLERPRYKKEIEAKARAARLD